MKSFKATLSLLLVLAATCSAKPIAFDRGKDLNLFITEPSLRPPAFNISQSNLSKIAPGYWFLAPYSRLTQSQITSQLETCQIGPHIFDNNGSLVWSGACEFHNSNVFDFKTWESGNSTGLSFILVDRWHANPYKPRHGVGVVLDQNFRSRRIHIKPDDESYNMHEFTVIDGGKRALMITGGLRAIEAPLSLAFPNNSALVWDGTLIEFNMATRTHVFEWKFSDHISLAESSVKPMNGEVETLGWDWIHPNSIDKFDNGDYLLSGRYTDTVYRVSSRDGSIIWRLGGTNSSFVLNGFNFSRQHDARIYSETDDKTIISLLNNAGDDVIATGTSSAGYLIELDTGTMKAKLIKQWLRPDGGRTRLRGNVQILSNDNVFISWSENGYITEYDPDGNIVLDAQFASHRFVTYRAYKFNFIGRPTHPPTVKAMIHELHTDTLISIYVSWNGATEVVSWNFYGGHDSSGANFALIGRSQKLGFETMLMEAGYYRFVYAEAISANGETIGVSNITLTEVPSSWDDDKKLATIQSSKGSAVYLSQSLLGSSKPHGIDLSVWSWWESSDSGTNELYPLVAGLALGVFITFLFMSLFRCLIR